MFLCRKPNVQIEIIKSHIQVGVLKINVGSKLFLNKTKIETLQGGEILSIEIMAITELMINLDFIRKKSRPYLTSHKS